MKDYRNGIRLKILIIFIKSIYNYIKLRTFSLSHNKEFIITNDYNSIRTLLNEFKTSNLFKFIFSLKNTNKIQTFLMIER